MWKAKRPATAAKGNSIFFYEWNLHLGWKGTGRGAPACGGGRRGAAGAAVPLLTAAVCRGPGGAASGRGRRRQRGGTRPAAGGGTESLRACLAFPGREERRGCRPCRFPPVAPAFTGRCALMRVAFELSLSWLCRFALRDQE